MFLVHTYVFFSQKRVTPSNLIRLKSVAFHTSGDEHQLCTVTGFDEGSFSGGRYYNLGMSRSAVSNDFLVLIFSWCAITNQMCDKVCGLVFWSIIITIYCQGGVVSSLAVELEHCDPGHFKLCRIPPSLTDVVDADTECARLGLLFIAEHSLEWPAWKW